jgi:sRNA-binding carbon storage regulator CsrA
MLRLLRNKYKTDIIITLPDGDLIKIKVMKMRTGSVELGFSFPKSVIVDRGEIYEKKYNKGVDSLPDTIL